MKDVPKFLRVLMYHRCPDDFESHLGYQKRSGYSLVHLGPELDKVKFFCFPYGAGWKTQEAREQRINKVLRQGGYIGALRCFDVG